MYFCCTNLPIFFGNVSWLYQVYQLFLVSVFLLYQFTNFFGNVSWLYQSYQLFFGNVLVRVHVHYHELWYSNHAVHRTRCISPQTYRELPKNFGNVFLLYQKLPKNFGNVFLLYQNTKKFGNVWTSYIVYQSIQVHVIQLYCTPCITKVVHYQTHP